MGCGRVCPFILSLPTPIIWLMKNMEQTIIELHKDNNKLAKLLYEERTKVPARDYWLVGFLGFAVGAALCSLIVVVPCL